MVKVTRIRAVALLLVVAALLISVSRGLAQEQGGSGLSVSPTRTELNVAPGKSEDLEINIKNVTSGVIIAKPFINDFEADGVTGEPRLYKDSNQRNSASINSFVTGLEEVRLDPGQDVDLKYKVTVPESAAPGAYYGAVTYRAVPANENNLNPGEVALTANVSSLVLLEVPGNITEKIQIEKVSAYLDAKASSFFTKAPNKSGVTIKNLGNSFAKPFGTVAVNNTFGKEVYKYELNNLNPRGNVLPNSTRTFIDDLKNVSSPGRYTITANVSYGRGGEILISKASFWYLPIWFIIVLLAVLALLILGGVYLYRRHGKKKLNSRRGR